MTINISNYTNMVYKIVNSYKIRTKNPSVDWDDIEQAGMIALYKCSNKFTDTLPINYTKQAIRRAVARQLDFYKAMENTVDIDCYEIQGYTNDKLEISLDYNKIKDKLYNIIKEIKTSNKIKCILLAKFLGVTTKDISERYNIHRNNVIKSYNRYKNYILSKLEVI